MHYGVKRSDSYLYSFLNVVFNIVNFLLFLPVKNKEGLVLVTF